MRTPFGLLDQADLLADAHEKAKNGQWVEAMNLCEQARDRETSTDSHRAATFFQFSARCHFEAAFQCRDRACFEEFMTRAKEAYAKASSLFDNVGQVAQSRRCKSRAVFSEFWEQADPQRRTALARASLELLTESATVSVGTEQHSQTLLERLRIFRESCNLATDSVTLRNDFENAVQTGRLVVKELEHSNDQKDCIEALNLMIWLLALEAQIILSPVDFQALSEEIRSYEQKLKAKASLVDAPYSHYLAKEGSGYILFDLVGDPRQALNEFESSLIEASKLGNVLLVGRLLWSISQVLTWLGFSESDSAKAKSLFESGSDRASQAIVSLQIPLQTTDLAASYEVFSICQIELSKLEIEAVRRKDRLKTAIEAASRGSAYESGTWAWNQAAHAKSRALYFLSRLEETKRRRSLLQEALEIRKETVEVTDRLLPKFWSPVVMRHDLALLQSELASFEQERAIANGLLAEAIDTMHSCLVLGESWATNPDFVYRLAQFNETYGNILVQYFVSTKDASNARSAVKEYETSIARFNESNHSTAIPPLRWKIARINDQLGNYPEAISEFRKAAEDYKGAAKDLPASASTYDELASYMSSWAIVESARLHHLQEDYTLAAEEYSKAARTLQETKTWSYLSDFATARSLLERGEAISQSEKHSRSIESFSEAAKIFGEARSRAEERVKKKISLEELEELRFWIGVAEDRQRYCRGRLLLEEAKNLDKTGDKKGSAGKYVSASESFGRLAEQTLDAQERAELETLAKFCQALAWMKQGESRVAPELYSKAAEMFMEVKEAASGEKLRLLALANGSICKSLDAGTRFRLTRDQVLYGEIKNHLETAADYYQEAGFRKAANWTHGYQRLFDSLFCLASAETEMDQRKKAERYDQAEKHLESAAVLFGEAGFPAKKLEALERLEHAREAKDVLISSIIGLSEMPTASGAVLTPLSLSRAQALGIERYEEANVVGNLTVSEREALPGSEVSYELDLTNVGRTTATLIRLENLVPQGLELDREKTPHHVEEGFLDLGGKSLEYLKTLRIKVLLKTSHTGSFELRPRVSFADDRGNYRFYENWAETITVQEPRGLGEKPKMLQPVPTVIKLPPEFRFETERSRRIFEYLVKEFLNDYMSKRLYVEKAGWRSLMDLTRGLKLPRSAVYVPGGRKGPALSELERRGLVEARIFPEERGRGGEITRVRVAYENGIVKRLLDRLVMEDKA